MHRQGVRSRQGGRGAKAERGSWAAEQAAPPGLTMPGMLVTAQIAGAPSPGPTCLGHSLLPLPSLLSLTPRKHLGYGDLHQLL